MSGLNRVVLFVGILAVGTTAAQYQDASKSKRLREGTKVTGVTGTFRFSGDRMAFYPSEGGQNWRLLENLALERVSRILEETHGERLWEISGTLTEFRGSNFLLLSRAAVKLKARAEPARTGRTSYRSTVRPQVSNRPSLVHSSDVESRLR